MTRMRCKQVAKRSIEVTLVVAQAGNEYKQVQASCKKVVLERDRFSVPHFARFGLRDFGSGFGFGCLADWFRLRFGCGFCCGPGWFPLRVRKTGSRYDQNGSCFSPHPIPSCVPVYICLSRIYIHSIHVSYTFIFVHTYARIYPHIPIELSMALCIPISPPPRQRLSRIPPASISPGSTDWLLRI